MTVMSAWWVRQSRRAAIEVALGKTAFYSLKPLLVVNKIELCS
jgi:hypothetical protein